jgi:sec-independent protein translocase protein TatB
MLPDLSPAHIIIVVVVALVVVGPKDLPMLLRKIGQFMGKMRSMANEFRASFDEMARQSELDELRKEVESMRAAANAATPDLGLTDVVRNISPTDIGPWHAAPQMTEAPVVPDSPPVETAPAPVETAPAPAEPDAPKPARKPRAKKPKPEAETGA